MSEAIAISVALVTRDRPEHLRRCLESWRRQTHQPFEIVVSDDSEGDEAQRRNWELAEEFRCRHVQGPRRGLYANRNCAAQACRGSHVLTADDDHTHPTDYLESIHRLAQHDPRRVWIFGELVPSRPDIALVCPAELRRNGTFGPPADPQSCAAIADGASLIPAPAFAGGVRYDEEYLFGPLWYLFGRKLQLAGWRISFSPATHVWHHWAPSFERLDPDARSECHLYVLAVNAFWLRASLPGWLRLSTAFARVGPRAGVRALRRALRWRAAPPNLQVRVDA
jgi:glycosyltransferase involved in cell wall biosynthesis